MDERTTNPRMERFVKKFGDGGVESKRKKEFWGGERREGADMKRLPLPRVIVEVDRRQERRSEAARQDR